MCIMFIFTFQISYKYTNMCNLIISERMKQALRKQSVSILRTRKLVNFKYYRLALAVPPNGIQPIIIHLTTVQTMAIKQVLSFRLTGH